MLEGLLSYLWVFNNIYKGFILWVRSIHKIMSVKLKEAASKVAIFKLFLSADTLGPV